MRKKLLASLFTLFWISICHADEVRPPVPLVFASEPSGSVVFAMNPPTLDADYKVSGEPFGIAYRLEREGKLKEIYRTKGWYSFKVYVSSDGRHLVQMGPWNRGHRPHKDHLAVAFHKDGKLMKRYSTAELVKNPEMVGASVSHYEWLGPDVGKDLTEAQQLGLRPTLDYDNRFTLHTIDGWKYVFDVTSGKITSAEKTKF